MIKPQEFYIQTGLYKEIKFEPALKVSMYHLLFSQTPIDSFCPECERDSVFQPVENFPHYRKDIGGLSNKITTSVARHPNDWSHNMKSNKRDIVTKKYTCTRQSTHELVFIMKIEGNVVQKIGQYPSLKDLAVQEIKKFRKDIGEEYFREYSTALGLFSNGVGVGSFIYLRRIIEKLIVKSAYEEAKLSKGWNDEKYQSSRVKERIKLLKKFLPDYLVTNPNVYSIISKGVHELSEEQCLDFFPALSAALKFVLSDMHEKRVKKDARDAVTKEISVIGAKINGGKP